MYKLLFPQQNRGCFQNGMFCSNSCIPPTLCLQKGEWDELYREVEFHSSYFSHDSLYSLDGILTLKNSGCEHTYDLRLSTKHLNRAEKGIRCLLKPRVLGHDLLHLAEPCSSLPIYTQVISDIDVNHYLIILL